MKKKDLYVNGFTLKTLKLLLFFFISFCIISNKSINKKKKQSYQNFPIFTIIYNTAIKFN